MSVKNIVRDLKEVTDGIENVSRREFETKTAHSFEHSLTENENSRFQSLISSDQQSPWAYLPSELLIDVVQRIEASHMSWPARKYIVACASVCRSWREVVKEVVKAPEETGRLTFPISLKQPGPRRNPIRCFVKRERETSTFRLYLGLSPSLMEEDGKLLFSAKRIRRATSTEFIVSLASDDFARASNTYIGRLRSNFLGTKFTIYDAQPQYGTTTLMNSRSIRTIHPNQVAPRAPTGNYNIATISYEINVLRPRGPRRIHCVLHSIPISSILGGTAPTPSRFHNSLEDTIPSSSPNSKNSISSSLTMPISDGNVSEPLILKNKAPRWHEQLHCWCLNFKGRVTVASVKNFQLVAMVDLSDQFFDFEEEKVILQFGKIGKDVFTMDYRYPLSAFQAFAICLSSFGTKPACE